MCRRVCRHACRRCNVNGPTAHWSDDPLTRRLIGSIFGVIPLVMKMCYLMTVCPTLVSLNIHDVPRLGLVIGLGLGSGLGLVLGLGLG